ncbi:hypothetical protein PQX77_017915 [Marasmius sp. AFHP31]|nr:hypothetical protein PQX77_017915 [Marasmius sp. AFHP31]
MSHDESQPTTSSPFRLPTKVHQSAPQSPTHIAFAAKATSTQYPRYFILMDSENQADSTTVSQVMTRDLSSNTRLQARATDLGPKPLFPKSKAPSAFLRPRRSTGRLCFPKQLSRQPTPRFLHGPAQNLKSTTRGSPLVRPEPSKRVQVGSQQANTKTGELSIGPDGIDVVGLAFETEDDQIAQAGLPGRPQERVVQTRKNTRPCSTDRPKKRARTHSRGPMQDAYGVEGKELADSLGLLSQQDADNHDDANKGDRKDENSGCRGTDDPEPPL